MSYLCLLASECAMAVVGDSRLTLSPVPLHWDKARKIGCDQGQRCLWACCGLTVFGGGNYAKLAARIFHGSGTLTEKAQALAKRVNPPLSIQRRLYRQTTTFSLLAGQWTEQGAELLTLDLDGKHTDLRRWPAPAFGGGLGGVPPSPYAEPRRIPPVQQRRPGSAGTGTGGLRHRRRPPVGTRTEKTHPDRRRPHPVGHLGTAGERMTDETVHRI